MRTRMMLCPSVPTPEGAQAKSGEGGL